MLGNHTRSALLFGAIPSLVCNFLYALYHGVWGVIQGSLWFAALCVFYGILAAARFCAVAFGNDAKFSRYVCWKLGAVGTLLILLSAALAWVNVISISQNIAVSYETIPMITIATYTFYKIVAAIVKAVKPRSEQSALLLVLRNISYAEAAASLVTLQRSMLVTFGKMEAEKAGVMNTLTGTVICLFILSLGIIMLIRAGKENRDGKIKAGKSK